jgi:hypothetical protein
LLVEQQVAVRTELDEQGRNISPVRFNGLDGARKVDRAVGRDRHPAARVYDFAGCIGPLPNQIADGRYFQRDYIEVADRVGPRRRSGSVHAAIGSDGNGVASRSVRDSLPDEIP